jgi:imidazole glycerol-phosphate synthase subunit HisH
LTIAIVDYGIGNLGSIKNMLARLGADVDITDDPAKLERASKLILPGVGAFDAGMQQLLDSGLRKILDHAALVRKVPVAGICLGMQLMTEGSEEGKLPGLGWVPANTVRFQPQADGMLKIPHMGWNSVTITKSSPVLDYLDASARFYFVHSYFIRCAEASSVLLQARYGDTLFDAAFQRGNLFGFQFHPEKSHRFGMALLRGFLEKA